MATTMLSLLAASRLAFVLPSQRLAPVAPPLLRAGSRAIAIMGRKPGVLEPEDLAAFVETAGEKLVVVDVRNPDFSIEPGDGKSNEKAPLSDCGTSARPRAVNAPFDRTSDSLDLSKLDALVEAGGGKAAPIITHCGGGGRGQKAKDYLDSQGFTNVVNGGGPEDNECWACFGTK